MEIKIDDIIIDTELAMDEQSQEAQTVLYDIMNNTVADITIDTFNRPISERWGIIDSGYDVVRTSVYISQEYDWHLKSQTITIEEGMKDEQ